MFENGPFWFYAFQYLLNNFKKGRGSGSKKEIKGNPKENYDFSFLFYSSSLKEGNLSSSVK